MAVQPENRLVTGWRIYREQQVEQQKRLEVPAPPLCCYAAWEQP